MDKYEFQIKTEQMEKLLKEKDYRTAAKIADSIDWRKVRNAALLTDVGEIYKNVERYDDSFEILNMAYEKCPIGRGAIYQMVEVAVKMDDFETAIDWYKEFVRVAPQDLARYELKYIIYRARGSSLEDQIAILEEYKSRDYREQWAYELATLYHQAGMLSKCVEECDDLILWFSEGEYVMKAMELKKRIQPLTASQNEKYRQMASDTVAEEIQVKPVNMDEFNTSNLQAALAEGLQDFIEEEHSDREAAAEDESQEPAPLSEEPEPIQDRETVYEPPAPKEEIQPEKEIPQIRDTIPLPKFLGQDESGQITFDMKENVLERQITGQMTIADILSGWEETKRETEAAIAEAARRDEERRKEREHLRATGQLPELNTEVVPTLPEDIQRLIDEIEGKIPVKIHVEPIQRTGEHEASGPGDGEIPEEIMDILAPGREASSEGAQSKALRDRDIQLPEDFDDIADILEAGTLKAEEKPGKTDKAPLSPVQEKPVKTDTAPLSPVQEKLEKALEAEVSSVPPGQLSKEQKELFAYFTSVRGMNQQLAELLEEDRLRRDARRDSLLGNIVITGERGSGKSTLAADIVKALQKQRGVKGSKMARVEAGSLNGKSIFALVKKLGGGALLIEDAGDMETETAVQLSHAMTRETGGLLVILEDGKKEIDELFTRCESLGAKFSRNIALPTFTNKELVAFGDSYAQEQGYVLDEMAVLALYNRIGRNQTSDHLVNVTEVKELVDEAIERGGKKGLFGKVKKSRINEEGNIILLEKDFEE